ncbi:cellulose-binding domain-containing protein [Saccharothrix sp. S26]|uniref:cellulose binding domain-containing protein n=1 Tax=Saccharothrix sp. S26 TaxID=2907215 RepID=UPI001F462D70|nr:cellulose binding domain-containing protein [Saccharothrix sp. S26]MCE6998327.1 cellulose-binding domain-containing protein [Saccharothrix sp. S26]
MVVLAGLSALLSGFAPGSAQAAAPAVVVDHGAGASRAIMPGAASAVVTVSLSSPPEGATTLTVALGERTPGVVFVSSRHTLTFTPTTWNVPQPVRIVSVRNFGSADFTVSGPGVTTGVIHVYASTAPTPPNLNRSCGITYTTHAWNGGFVTAATVTNTGPTTLTDWTVTALFGGDERVTASWNSEWGQYADAAALSAPPWARTLAPGQSVSLGLQGTVTRTAGGPWLNCVPEPYLLPGPTTTTSLTTTAVPNS